MGRKKKTPRPIKYKSVAHFVKEDNKDLHVINGRHLCGGRMLSCAKCHNMFCPTCDMFVGKIPDCCNEAIEAYTEDNDRKTAEKEALAAEMKKRIKRRQKFKVKIEEIDNKNKLI